MESFSFLYLNPPYDSEIGSMDNKRMEFLFLEHTYRWLVESGVLLMVVPQSRLDSSIPLLAEGFELRRVTTAATSAGIKAGCSLAKSFDLRFSASNRSRKTFTRSIFEILRLGSLTRKCFASDRFR